MPTDKAINRSDVVMKKLIQTSESYLTLRLQKTITKKHQVRLKIDRLPILTTYEA